MQKAIRTSCNAQKPIRIAVDGFSSTGKSTLAKDLARECNYLYIDTGAMYRTITLAMLREGIERPESLTEGEIEAFLNRHKVGFAQTEEGGQPQVTLDGVTVGNAIREPRVAEMVSTVAALPAVRVALVAQQRAIAEGVSVVMDGRDIGTVVFPDAEVKIFMTASPSVRAQRRYEELQEKGIAASYEAVLENLTKRDKADQDRVCDPLRKAEDAVEIDNSELNREQQLTQALTLVRARVAVEA